MQDLKSRGIQFTSRLACLALALAACSSPAAVPASASPANDPVRIVLVGDSTVTDKSGWGLGFKEFLTEGAACLNTAAGGRSSKSFIAEGRWETALAIKGDYYLIQFGHNDEPGKGPERETDPDTTYYTNMMRFVDEARAIGAKPVLVTSLVRRSWDKGSTSRIKSSLVPYVEAVKRLAAAKHVPLIDLHERSKELCEAWGKELCVEFSPVNDGKVDNTHLNAKGSVIFARLVIENLVRIVPELKPCFRDEPTTNLVKRVFNIRQFGAKGDGRTFNTAAIQQTLDLCAKYGGIVQLPAGTYLSGPLFLRSCSTFQLDEGAVLQATDDPDQFANPDKPGAVLALLNGNTLTDITITGKGTIDGAGARWWEPVKAAKKSGQPEPRRRPRLVVMSNCVNLKVKGVTLQNSPSFHLVPADCETVDIEDVTIRAPEDSPNTDAIDPSASRYVHIVNCVLDVGDDNVAIKSGHHDLAHPNGAAEHIVVTNCTFLHGHGMSIGSETVGGVHDLRVENCTFKDTTSGIRIKSDRTRGGLVDDLTYRNITMENVKIPINITTYYPKIPKEDAAQLMAEKTPIYRNIRIVNLTATSPQSVGFIVGLPECVVSNVVLENVHLSAPKGLTVRNAAAIQFKDSSIKVEAGEPLILETNAVVTGLEAAAKN